MKLDPTKLKDWQIAEAAEANLKKAKDLAHDLGLKDDEWTPYGDVLAKIDVTKVLKRLEGEEQVEGWRLEVRQDAAPTKVEG